MAKPNFKFVMVTATYMRVSGSTNVSREGRGIARLKRGQTHLDFMQAFMAERGITEFTANERTPGLWYCLPQAEIKLQERTIMSFFFCFLAEEELSYYAKRLKPQELQRDIKNLRLKVQPC